jgi:hypothetical protein
MSMSRATRQIVVAHLTDRDMNPQEIADELGVSRETVRRDLLNAPPVEPRAEAPDADPGSALVLPVDEALREALAVLRSVRNGADTTAQNVAVVRAAVRATADTVIAARQPRTLTPVPEGV